MITLRDKLSHLSYLQARRLLGPEGERLIRTGGKYEIDLSQQVSLNRDLFRLDLMDAVVTIQLDPARNQRLRF